MSIKGSARQWFEGALARGDVATAWTSAYELGRLSLEQPEDAHKPVPYIFVAPRDRLTVGQLAADVFREHLACSGGRPPEARRCLPSPSPAPAGFVTRDA